MSGIALSAVVLDCPDPRALGAFYAEVLGGTITDDSEDSWVDVDVPGAAVALSFQRVADHEPPSWPAGVPQQIHLDLRVEDFTATHERVVSLGAVPLDPTDPPSPDEQRGYRVYADPVGHPFCLCRC